MAQIVKHPLQSCLYTNRGSHVSCRLYTNGGSIQCKVIVVNNIFQRLLLECCDYDVFYMYIQKSRYVLFLCTSICPEYLSSLKLQEETKTEEGKKEIKRSNA